MTDTVHFRKVRKQLADGSWQTCEFQELHKGDLFRYEDGEDSMGIDGTVYRVSSDPVPCEPPGNYALTVNRAEAPT
jgi:hypothetical protein